MKIEEYKDEYLLGVVGCLKRNFQWMGERSDEDIIKWMDPIINYKWGPDHDPGEKRYSRGVVLLDDNGNVVGFSGVVSSKQTIDGKECLYGNMTTTAVDQKYRFCMGAMFRFFDKSYDYDLLSGYTAREEVRDILTRFFQYETIDTLGYLFLPIPMIKNKNVKIRITDDSSEIMDTDLRAIYEDHEKYNVKCAVISADGKVCHLFYRIVKKEKKGIKCRCTRVLYTSDPVLCGKYAKDIIWFLEKKERAIFDADSRFFGGEKINYPMPYVKRNRVKLEERLNGTASFFPYGLFYSELGILI